MKSLRDELSYRLWPDYGGDFAASIFKSFCNQAEFWFLYQVNHDLHGREARLFELVKGAIRDSLEEDD